MLRLLNSTRWLVSAALLLGMMSGSAPSQREIRPSNHTLTAGGKIVFASERDGNYEIYVVNPDGSGPTRLTNSPLISEREPAWS
ncbi:MAG: hypothetical protein M3371_07475, partial [Acidobacteriota bacterium]|nr:hypothetical protein [Acidobacteriota bacterium]